MALVERPAQWPDTDHMIFVKVATGIGAEIISGGQLQRGADGTAGNIGHIPISRGALVPYSYGNMGCLEALASGFPARSVMAMVACVAPRSAAATIPASALKAI